MKTLNDIITISTLTVTKDANGDDSESWSAPVTVRAHVEQVDGTRYLKDNELTDKTVYRIELYNNSYSNNIRIVYNTLTLYPVRITKNKGASLLSEVVIIAATKS